MNKQCVIKLDEEAAKMLTDLQKRLSRKYMKPSFIGVMKEAFGALSDLLDAEDARLMKACEKAVEEATRL